MIRSIYSLKGLFDHSEYYFSLPQNVYRIVSITVFSCHIPKVGPDFFFTGIDTDFSMYKA